MSRTPAKSKPTKPGAATQLIAKNRKAYFNYDVDEDIEAGLVLRGSEVKSLREGRVQLQDAYATIERGEAFLHGLHISLYSHSSAWVPDPRATRKLLLHKREIDRLERKVEEKGFTLIPLELYFSGGRVKVKLGLCKGKKEYDKREAVKERDVDRELRQRG